MIILKDTLHQMNFSNETKTAFTIILLITLNNEVVHKRLLAKWANLPESYKTFL